MTDVDIICPITSIAYGGFAIFSFFSDKSLSLLCIAGLFCVSAVASARSTTIGTQSAFRPHALKVLSLNLHGPHPMGAPTRYLQERNGTSQPSPSHIYYFTHEELRSGQSRRELSLAHSIQEILPDIVFLQEVTAIRENSSSRCPFFYTHNNAQFLQKKLEHMNTPYKALSACRGNTGWTTTSQTFKNKRVITKVNGKEKVVFDYGSNPYPRGVVTEGSAILVKKNLTVLDHYEWTIPYNHFGGEVFIQAARVQVAATGEWILAVNMHLGHKVEHFEQAVAIRRYVSDYLYNLPAQAWYTYRGTVYGGDFNGQVFRPKKKFAEASLIPWELVANNEFNFLRLDNPRAPEQLKPLLKSLNENRSYKAWANINDAAMARSRIQNSVSLFMVSQMLHPDTFAPLKETRIHSKNNRLPEFCDRSKLNLQCSPSRDYRIDYFFVSQNMQVENFAILWSSNNWVDTTGISDHPGIYSEVSF